MVDELGRLQTVNNEANARGDYVPCVVILNSVVNAIALEDALVNAGIPRQAIAPIRGLSSRSSRDVRGKQLVIGTSAIEVGIDFQADHLFFEAGDAASFMQRFGRIGRHRPGIAWLLCDSRESAALTCLGNEISRDRDSLSISRNRHMRDEDGAHALENVEHGNAARAFSDGQEIVCCGDIHG